MQWSQLELHIAVGISVQTPHGPKKTYFFGAKDCFTALCFSSQTLLLLVARIAASVVRLRLTSSQKEVEDVVVAFV